MVKRLCDWTIRSQASVETQKKVQRLVGEPTGTSIVVPMAVIPPRAPSLQEMKPVRRYSPNTYGNIGELLEIPMSSYKVCNLGAINLPEFVIDAFGEEPKIDWDKLKETIRVAVRFLDNVLDITKYPLKRIEETILQWRKIGLGYTGFGDMLAMLKIPYDSKEALEITKKLAETFRNTAYETSIELAKERGSFDKFDRDKYLEGNFIKRLPNEIRENIRKYGIRNESLLTTAPTGTTSLTVGENCSSGIEPIFSLYYNRRYRDYDENLNEVWKEEVVYDKAFLIWLEKNGYNVDDNYEVPEYFKTTMEISPKAHIDIQSIWQYYIDNSISKTINIPEGYTYEQYKELFWYAYEKELKGFTTFNVNGCGFLDTKIKTEKGDMTFEQILEYEGYDIEEVYQLRGEWLSLNKPLKVYDINNELQNISKLFIKGISNDVYEIIFEDGNKYYFTGEHKLRLKNGEWKKVRDLQKGDELDGYFRKRSKDKVHKKIEEVLNENKINTKNQ